MSPYSDTPKKTNWLESRIRANFRVIKYGVVACSGIVINLGTLALLFTVSPHRGWMQSAIANIASTLANFVSHNLWTFSDRQHQGMRLIRGFLSFACMSAAGISITTLAYVAFTRMAASLVVASSHLGGLGIVLVCQFFAILLGGAVSYVLNWQFTWAQSKQTSRSESAPAQVQEI